MRSDERGGEASVADLMAGFLKEQDATGAMSENHVASLAWRAVNGDIERAHTTGVFVKPGRTQGAAPVICVYVDSKARSVDFRANREVYLGRLEAAGKHYSGIEFIVTRYPVKKRKQVQRQAVPLPELTEAERAECARLAQAAPQALRESVYKAISASFRRDKASND